MTKEKNYSVESLRGAAIILVVAGHVIGSASDGGMKVADDSALRYFYYTFEYLRMPLFTVISGWVYALNPVRTGSFTDFNIKKIRRILLPLVFVGTTYFLLQYFTPGTNMKGNISEIWKIYFFPYTLYWFLPSLFLVFVLMSVIDINNIASLFRHWLIITTMAFVFYMMRDQLISQAAPNYFSYKGAVYLLPFFLIGVGFKRFEQILAHKNIKITLLIIFVFSFAFQQIIWFSPADTELLKTTGMGLIIGVSGIYLLFQVKWNVPFLVFWGSYAYSIYLFHSFGTAGGRIILGYVGVSQQVVVFIICILLGITLPVVVEKILVRNTISSMLFLGRNPKKTHRKPAKQPIKAASQETNFHTDKTFQQ
jgi:fucose 4-O-acetylase-like acetyltransferase